MKKKQISREPEIVGHPEDHVHDFRAWHPDIKKYCCMICGLPLEAEQEESAVSIVADVIAKIERNIGLLTLMQLVNTILIMVVIVILIWS